MDQSVAYNNKAVILFLLFVILGYFIGCGKKTKEENYPDGKLKAVYNYNDAGLLDGAAKEYYPSGKLQSEETYKNNVREGIAKKYYESGQLNTEVNLEKWKSGGHGYELL